MLSEMEHELKKEHMNYSIGPSKEWVKDIGQSKYNLAPRGFGRTSFRLAEIIQIGRIPAYIYDDYSWLPYQGTELALSGFGFSGKMGSLRQLAKEMKSSTEETFIDKMQRLLEVREHYTLGGVIKQIELFLKDPLGPKGGQLRCTRVPDKEH
jgi:hypothetical protein